MTDDLGKERLASEILLDLHNELSAMPETRLINKLLGFNTSIYVFQNNFNNLVKFISFLSNSREADHLFYSRNNDLFENSLDEIIRLLHNFDASVVSLIDHTRNLYRNLAT
jgi:hypothetical protein